MIIAAGGTIPLLLYIWFGPPDGNPIGLGLLMSLCWLIGLILVAVGVGLRLSDRGTNA